MNCGSSQNELSPFLAHIITRKLQDKGIYYIVYIHNAHLRLHTSRWYILSPKLQILFDNIIISLSSLSSLLFDRDFAVLHIAFC